MCDEIPADRCGFLFPEDVEVEPRDFSKALQWHTEMSACCCWRETWQNSGRCIWHASIENKPAGELSRTRINKLERLDGAVLRKAELGDSIDFANSFLATADFTGAFLRSADLTNANLWRAKLTDANLWGANLSTASLAEAKLQGANLVGSNLREAGLGGADLIEADLTWANLTSSYLREVDLSRASLLDADLTDADLLSADLVNTNLKSTDFTNANLRKANFTNADLSRANLTNASFWKANLTSADLVGVDLCNSNLRKANFIDADLRGSSLIDAELQEANLTNVELKKSNLAGTHLIRTNFREANLTHTNLTDANFYRAILISANLEDAILENADLDAADLTDARLHNCRLQNVYISEETTFGDRCIYEKEVREAIETDGLTEDQLEPIEKAISIYRTYQRLLRENSLPGDIPQYFYREKEMRRLKARAEGNHLEWGYRELQKWVMGYGERPWRVVGTSLLVILVFAGLYPLAGGVDLETDVAGPEFLTYLYFSGVTFTTLGYGDVHPLTQAAQQLAVVQSFLGAALMALLVAVLTRRAMR